MGYRPGNKLYNIEFATHPGLVVRAKSTSLGRLMHVASLNVKINETDDEKKMEIFTFFASLLEYWNIEHPDTDREDGACERCGLFPGDDLPITVAGMLCLDLDFIMEIILGWMTAVARVSLPKEMNSSNGENPLEAMMMQLAQQASPLTSPMPNSS